MIFPTFYRHLNNSSLFQEKKNPPCHAEISILERTPCCSRCRCDFPDPNRGDCERAQSKPLSQAPTTSLSLLLGVKRVLPLLARSALRQPVDRAGRTGACPPFPSAAARGMGTRSLPALPSAHLSDIPESTAAWPLPCTPNNCGRDPNL